MPSAPVWKKTIKFKTFNELYGPHRVWEKVKSITPEERQREEMTRGHFSPFKCKMGVAFSTREEGVKTLDSKSFKEMVREESLILDAKLTPDYYGYVLAVDEKKAAAARRTIDKSELAEVHSNADKQVLKDGSIFECGKLVKNKGVVFSTVIRRENKKPIVFYGSLALDVVLALGWKGGGEKAFSGPFGLSLCGSCIVAVAQLLDLLINVPVDMQDTQTLILEEFKKDNPNIAVVGDLVFGLIHFKKDSTEREYRNSLRESLYLCCKQLYIAMDVFWRDEGEVQFINHVRKLILKLINDERVCSDDVNLSFEPPDCVLICPIPKEGPFSYEVFPRTMESVKIIPPVSQKLLCSLFKSDFPFRKLQSSDLANVGDKEQQRFVLRNKKLVDLMNERSITRRMLVASVCGSLALQASNEDTDTSWLMSEIMEYVPICTVLSDQGCILLRKKCFLGSLFTGLPTTISDVWSMPYWSKKPGKKDLVIRSPIETTEFTQTVYFMNCPNLKPYYRAFYEKGHFKGLSPSEVTVLLDTYGKVNCIAKLSTGTGLYQCPNKKYLLMMNLSGYRGGKVEEQYYTVRIVTPPLMKGRKERFCVLRCSCNRPIAGGIMGKCEDCKVVTMSSSIPKELFSVFGQPDQLQLKAHLKLVRYNQETPLTKQADKDKLLSKPLLELFQKKAEKRGLNGSDPTEGTKRARLALVSETIKEIDTSLISDSMKSAEPL